ncbi:hypothetical protein HBB16_11800 [Pseudonocardia sp. MCCB 268]|nr:hypothetical protein [Pseudonocardia cytotoxica]
MGTEPPAPRGSGPCRGQPATQSTLRTRALQEWISRSPGDHLGGPRRARRRGPGLQRVRRRARAAPPDRARRLLLLPSAGGLGWGLPAALGAKYAAPDRTVVATLGDGAYLFANPGSLPSRGREARPAVLTVIANNGGWWAVDAATYSSIRTAPR